MITAHNGTCTQNCDLLTDIRIAKEAGYGGIEIIGAKLYRHLEQGGDIPGVQDALDGFPVVGLGYVQDIERYRPGDRVALFRETEKMCRLARELDCSLVQILTGPIGPGIGEGVRHCYKDIVEMSWPELQEITVPNIVEIAAIGAQYEISFYLEALSWAPIHTVDHMLELIDTAACDNLGVLIDFWHCFTSGSMPDEIAKIDKDLIRAVHFCDSAKGDGSSHHDRDIWTGDGIIPLAEWMRAIVSTGYDGWAACELFSLEHWGQDPQMVATRLREHLESVLGQVQDA